MKKEQIQKTRIPKSFITAQSKYLANAVRHMGDSLKPSHKKQRVIYRTINDGVISNIMMGIQAGMLNWGNKVSNRIYDYAFVNPNLFVKPVKMPRVL